MSAETNATFEQIRQALDGATRIGVASHIRPDGDAYGSSLAMALYLRACGKDVRVWNDGGLTPKFRYLPQNALVIAPPQVPQDFDVFLAVDTSTKERLGSVLQAVGNVKTWINIDHHVSNHRYADLNYIANAPATAQVIYDYLRFVNVDITPDMAVNLYVGLSTDTGSFQYRGTTPHTLRVAADLIEYGVDVAAVSQAMYDNYPRRRLELLGALLHNAHFCCEGRAAGFSLTLETARRLGVSPEDNEGLIDHLRSVEGVQVAVFLEETPEGKVRVSMRSKEARFNVSHICSAFGGGGHTLAAGARLPGPLAEAEKKVWEVVCHEIRKHD